MGQTPAGQSLISFTGSQKSLTVSLGCQLMFLLKATVILRFIFFPHGRANFNIKY